MIGIQNTCLHQNTDTLFIRIHIQNIDIKHKTLYIQRHRTSMKFVLCFSPIVDLVNTLLEETEINIFSQDFGVEYIALFMHIHLQYSPCIYLYLKM